MRELLVEQWFLLIFRYINNLKQIKVMKKSDLRSGMIVENAKGEQGIVLLNSPNGDVVAGMGMAPGRTWFPLSSIDQDLKRVDGGSTRASIVKVYTAGSNASLGSPQILAWERLKEVTLTLEEIARKFNLNVNQLRIKE